MVQVTPLILQALNTTLLLTKFETYNKTVKKGELALPFFWIVYK